MLRRRHAVRRPAAVVLAAALLVSGCSGTSEEPDAGPGSSGSPSPSVSSPFESPSPSASASSEPAVPEPPAPPEPRRGPAGQKAFARYVMKAWLWSLRSNDASPLLEASASKKRPCLGCERLAKELRRRDKAGWYVDLQTVAVDRTGLRRDGDVVVASSRVDIPKSDSYYEDGSYRSSSPAHEDATFTVRMRYESRDYVLVSFTVA